MKKSLIALALVFTITTIPSITLAKGSFGGGSHASFSSGSHSSGSFGGSHSSSGSFGGGFSSGEVKSSGSFTHTSEPTSFGGGFNNSYKSSGTFKPAPATISSPIKTPIQMKAKSDAKTTSNNAKITQDNTRIVNHTTYINSHPYGYYYNPFSSNWFMWWWMFGTHHGVEQTKVIIDCSKPENTTAPDCKGITPVTPAATTTSQTTTGK